MKIAPIKNQAFCNLSFRSKVVETRYGKVPDKLKEAVDTFEENNTENAKKIGEGLSSYAYKMFGSNCVIKVSKPCEAGKRNGDFSDEARSLQLIPEDFNQAQKLIGSVRTEKNNWYLLTTYVNGKVPDGKIFKWDKKSMASALSAFADLDTAHVYHGDLARSNCLVTKDGDVRLLDFQYSRKFNFMTEKDHKENAKTYKVPYFIAPSNAQMFEGANFATYLTFLDEKEAKRTFCDYVKEKSNYHKKRAAAFEEQGARAEIVEYEKLRAKFLKHPTKEILDLCARKMEILLLHRYTNSSVEGYYSKLSAPSYYLMLIQKSNQMAEKAAALHKKESNPELKKFYKYEMQDAEFWRNSMLNELDGRYDESSVYRWIVYEAEFLAPKIRDDGKTDKFIPLPEIYKTLTTGNEEVGLKPLDEEDEVSFWLRAKANELRKTSSYHCIRNTKEHKEINGYFDDKKAIIATLNNAREAYLSQKQFESLYYGLEAFYETENLRQKALKISKQPYVKDYNKEKMVNEADFLSGYKENMKEMNEWMYGRLLSFAYPNDPEIV